MSRFGFAVSGVATRQEGIIESESFGEALNSLGQHVDVRTGDQLEIGVVGFPPARFECVGEIKSGYPIWIPSGQLAA